MLRQFAIATPSIFLADAQPWTLEPAFYDVSVVLPPASRRVVGRPDWLTLDGMREPVAIDLDLSDQHLPCVLEARYAAESDKAVPADRVLIESHVPQAVLFLRPGSYRISAADAEAHPIFQRTLHVEASAPDR